jgi:hypothetical protein
MIELHSVKNCNRQLNNVYEARAGIMIIASAYRTEESRVRTPPGYDVFMSLYIAVLLPNLKMHCKCVYAIKNAFKIFFKIKKCLRAMST